MLRRHCLFSMGMAWAEAERRPVSQATIILQTLSNEDINQGKSSKNNEGTYGKGVLQLDPITEVKKTWGKRKKQSKHDKF